LPTPNPWDIGAENRGSAQRRGALSGAMDNALLLLSFLNKYINFKIEYTIIMIIHFFRMMPLKRPWTKA
jgi:hypothetical protein